MKLMANAIIQRNSDFIPVANVIKENCVALAEKYLSNEAIEFYQRLPTDDEGTSGDNSD